MIIECPLKWQYHDHRDVILTSWMAVSNNFIMVTVIECQVALNNVKRHYHWKHCCKKCVFIYILKIESWAFFIYSFIHLRPTPTPNFYATKSFKKVGHRFLNQFIKSTHSDGRFWLNYIRIVWPHNIMSRPDISFFLKVGSNWSSFIYYDPLTEHINTQLHN